MLLEQVDLAPLGQTFPLLNNYNVVLYWFMAFAIGTGLAIREHDDRTLAFLDGLPVSRSRVFFVKCAVMSALVLIGPLLELAALGGLHLLSRGSLDRELHGALLLQGLALQALLLVNGLMLGAAFGRLRSLTWAAAGLAAAALVLLVERVPRAALLNPLTLLDWEWTSAGIVVDSETVRTQIAATAIAALVAWQGFVRAGKARRPLNVSGPIAGAVVVVATWDSRRRARAGDATLDESLTATAQGDAGSYEFAPSPPAQTLTRHYRISYPAHEAEAALALAAEADAVFERVHALARRAAGRRDRRRRFGLDTEHHGRAFLGRLRMQLDSEGSRCSLTKPRTSRRSVWRAPSAIGCGRPPSC